MAVRTIATTAASASFGEPGGTATRCKFAAELARLHREHGVEVINFADENPTASRAAWQAFLEALIAQKVPLILVGSTRASDIVRDADILHLYKRAGVARLLLGIESTDETHAAGDSQGEHAGHRPRGDSAAEKASDHLDGRLGGRLRAGNRPGLLAHPAADRLPTTRTRSRRSMPPRIGGLPLRTRRPIAASSRPI